MHSGLGRVFCVTLSISAGSVTAWAQRGETEPYWRMEVLLTTTANLSEAARAAMMTEASAIWRAHGVAIDWLAPTAIRPVSEHRLRVLVVEQRHSPRDSTKAITVGELLRPSNGHPLAMMSLASAQRLVASVRGPAWYDLNEADERRVGVVLGRALAHEIGHYLLGTHTHASTGLMRPRFDALEFTDLRDGTFALDPKASEWLKSREPHDRFAYAN
jgi:hypothetical protein